MEQADKIRNKTSLWVYFICCAFLLSSVFAIVKLNLRNIWVSTLTWDAAGYYLYLPAFFYDDPGKLNNIDYIQKKYSPFGGGSFFSAFKQPNGNYVFKYTCGQAIMFFPAFVVGHLWAKYGGYPVDGFSYPYNVSVALGCVFFSFIGLWFTRKALLKYYSDKIVALSLFVLCFVTNYYNFVSFSGALTHCNLFTLYALIIYLSIIFYEKPSFLKAAAIGLLSGLAVITRPSEIICVLIPFLWGVANWDGFKNRLKTLVQQYGKIAMYVFCAGLVGAIQLIYWKKYTGHFFFWTYEPDQTFSFLSPHIADGLFSYRKGWFMYTPVMMLSLLGFIPLYKSNRNIFWPCVVFTVINLYITFSWDQWWYGGSFSQRGVVQSYSVLAFPLSSFFVWAFRKRVPAVAFGLFILFCFWLNMVMTYQANATTIMENDCMNRAYYWRIFGKTSVPKAARKLLDNDEEIPTKLEANLGPVFISGLEHSFYNDSTVAYSGKKSLLLNKQIQGANILVPAKEEGKGMWYRADIKIFPDEFEWSRWKQTMFSISLKNKGKEIKRKAIHIEPIIGPEKKWQEVFVDIYAPEESRYDTIEVSVWHADSETKMYLSDLKLMSVEKK